MNTRNLQIHHQKAIRNLHINIRDLYIHSKRAQNMSTMTECYRMCMRVCLRTSKLNLNTRHLHIDIRDMYIHSKRDQYMSTMTQCNIPSLDKAFVRLLKKLSAQKVGVLDLEIIINI